MGSMWVPADLRGVHGTSVTLQEYQRVSGELQRASEAFEGNFRFSEDLRDVFLYRCNTRGGRYSGSISESFGEFLADFRGVTGALSVVSEGLR